MFVVGAEKKQQQATRTKTRNKVLWQGLQPQHGFNVDRSHVLNRKQMKTKNKNTKKQKKNQTSKRIKKK